jgi:exosome complex component RRP43
MSGFVDVNNLDADAFRKLYPEQYFQRFLDDGIRPDGRTIGRSRATTIGIGTISSVEGSALVKQGNTTIVSTNNTCLIPKIFKDIILESMVSSVYYLQSFPIFYVKLAGVRTSLSRPKDSHPDYGSLTINVELAPFSSADWRPGRAPELVSTVSQRLHQVLLGTNSSEGVTEPCSTSGSGTFSLHQLCIASGKACWSLLLDVYILNADGSVFDTVLLAAVAALLGTQVPLFSLLYSRVLLSLLTCTMG